MQVKRVCSELHGLASQITRTRKVEVQEDKAVREVRPVPVAWSQQEHDFYQAYYQWCVQRAKAKAMPLNFAMQMPLRLAGSCLPEAAEYVRTWSSLLKRAGRDRRDRAGHTLPKGVDVPPSSELIAKAARLGVDTKLAQFDGVVQELLDQGKQALVFTFSRRTLAYLERHLRGKCRVAVLHGGVAKEQRDRVMADFRAGAYDIVVATKVASEGLDFEFCSVLVNYDLPWNPMEIEQRIGRIDRIGQSEEKIIIINFTTPGTIESDILERVLERIGVFEHAIGALEPIIDSAWTEIESALLDFALDARLRREQRTQELLAALAEQERALEEVESAAPYLISSDGVDIEGLEPDLLASGRYIGQAGAGPSRSGLGQDLRRSRRGRRRPAHRHRQRRARRPRADLGASRRAYRRRGGRGPTQACGTSNPSISRSIRKSRGSAGRRCSPRRIRWFVLP